jgi:epoxyqueuosine reductase
MGVSEGKPRLLLHVCCGPCATAVLERLLERFHVTAFWHNPNIQPSGEHDLRLEQARIVARELEVELVVDEGGGEAWEAAVRGLEGEPEGGARCEVCQRVRLEAAAREAASRGIENVATTLTISPHKVPEVVNRAGREAAEALGVCFLEEDFKQGGGFERSSEMGKEMGLSRQKYCGCLFARRDS